MSSGSREGSGRGFGPSPTTNGCGSRDERMRSDPKQIRLVPSPGREPERPEPDRARPGEGQRGIYLERLKAEIRAGTYQADIRDIAMQLARAMDAAV